MAEKMTEQEIKDWKELCSYVKKDILKYDDSIKFPKFLILRLKGLKNGKFMANNKTEPLANYTFSEILLTFKANKIYLDNILKNDQKFKDEKHKINYIMTIIESKITDIALRYRRVEDSKLRGENIEIHTNNNKSEYKSRTKAVTNSRLKGLI